MRKTRLISFVFVVLLVWSAPAAKKAKPSPIMVLLDEATKIHQEITQVLEGFNLKIQTLETLTPEMSANLIKELQPLTRKLYHLETQMIHEWLKKPTSEDLRIILAVADGLSAHIWYQTDLVCSETQMYQIGRQLTTRSSAWLSEIWFLELRKVDFTALAEADLTMYRRHITLNPKYLNTCFTLTEKGIQYSRKVITERERLAEQERKMAQTLTSQELIKKYQTSQALQPFIQSNLQLAKDSLPISRTSFELWLENLDPFSAAQTCDGRYLTLTALLALATNKWGGSWTEQHAIYQEELVNLNELLKGYLARVVKEE